MHSNIGQLGVYKRCMRCPIKGNHLCFPGSDHTPQSRWWDATFHTVTAVVGVGVLSLPYAFSYLTWTGGLVALGVTTATSLYTGWQLASLHEDKDGRRHNRYRWLTRHPPSVNMRAVEILAVFWSASRNMAKAPLCKKSFGWMAR